MVKPMSESARSDELATALAEKILQKIYGDDLAGCPVSLDSIAAVIASGLRNPPSGDLLALYEKVVEAVHLLSAPPPAEKIADPKELQSLLTERLDSIHVVTTKTLETVARFKAQ